MGTPCDSQRTRFSQRVTVLPCTLGRTTTRWRHPRQAITPARRPSCGPRTLAAQGRQHSVSTASAVSAQRQHSVSITLADHPRLGRATTGWRRPRQAITRARRPSCAPSTRAVPDGGEACDCTPVHPCSVSRVEAGQLTLQRYHEQHNSRMASPAPSYHASAAAIVRPEHSG